MKDGSEVAWSEPFFVLDFRNRDSLAEPRPVSGAVVAANGKTKVSYSRWFNSGRRASNSASLASLRGCLGSRAMRVKVCPMPKRIR